MFRDLQIDGQHSKDENIFKKKVSKTENIENDSSDIVRLEFIA